MPPTEPPTELAILDEVIGRLRSRLATGDDSELGPLGTLLLKYLERRAEIGGSAPEKPGTIAAVTRKLQSVGGPTEK